jgi:hypothetical protein
MVKMNNGRLMKKFPWKGRQRKESRWGRRKRLGIPKEEEYGLYIIFITWVRIHKVELSFEVGLVRRLDGYKTSPVYLSLFRNFDAVNGT